MKLPWSTALHRETDVSRRTSRIRLVKTNCIVNLMFKQQPIEIGRLSHLRVVTISKGCAVGKELELSP